MTLRKNSKILAGVLILAVVIGFVGIVDSAQAASNSVTFSAETILLVGGQKLYVLAGGTAASYSVGLNSVSFYMENGSSITVRSLGKKVMSSTIAGAYSCASTYSEVSLASTATQTLTITPSDDTCSVTAGGGGGGGSVSSAASTPTTVETTQTTVPAPTPTVTSAPTTTSEPSVTAQPVATPAAIQAPVQQFAKRLVAGSKGDDVQRLQEALFNNGVYAEGLITGTFGALTKKAVQKFQEKYGIANQGDVGYGEVGPNTRAKLNELIGAQSAQATVSAPANTSAQKAVQAQLESQIQTLQEQVVILLAELAKQLQSQTTTQ